MNLRPDSYSAGILNAVDKCPKLNAAGDQDDVDGDNVGNLCDNCPNNHNALNNGAQVGKVCTRVKWPIRSELIQVSVA